MMTVETRFGTFEAAEHDVLHDHRVEVVALDQGLEDVGPEVGRVDLAQAPAPLPHRGAQRVDDVGLGHDGSFRRRAPAQRVGPGFR